MASDWDLSVEIMLRWLNRELLSQDCKIAGFVSDMVRSSYSVGLTIHLSSFSCKFLAARERLPLYIKAEAL